MIQVLKRPLLTEKSKKLEETVGHYAFEVDPKANKIQIKQAIESRFGVSVISVRTVRMKGKSKTQMTRRGIFQGKTSLRKKAYITLQSGQKLDIFESDSSES